MVRRVALLDRDGTLIDVVRDEATGMMSVAFHPDHVRFLPGAVEGARMLRDAGFLLALVTNQPAPAKGQFSRAAVERTNAAVVEQLALAGVEIAQVAVCLHHPGGGPGGDDSFVCDCNCRKPKPGLLLEVLEKLGADPHESWMIGDSVSDLQAGRAAGVRTGLVFAPHRCELCPHRHGLAAHPDVQGATVLAVAQQIVDSL
jgi:D-glycero-D-manno-heptose 1,7-bisphosphate phosphatase